MRVASDVRLSERLIAKLDSEKGISENQLVSKEEGAATAGKPEGVKNEEPSDEKDKDKKEANGKAGPMEDTKMAEPTAVPEDKDAVKAGTSEGEELENA